MALPIEKILASVPHIKKDGSVYVIPEEVDANAYIALGQEVLQIARLARVELSSEVMLQTHKGERFYFGAEQVVGFRFGSGENKNKIGGAGFTKS